MGVSSVASLIIRGEDEGFSDLMSSVGGGIQGVIGSFGGLSGIGAGVAGVVTSVGLALNEMADFAGEADDQIRGVVIRTGDGAEALGEYKGQVMALQSSPFIRTFEEGAEAIGKVRSITRLAGDDLLFMSQRAVLVSEAFDTDLTETVRAADTVMEQFKENAGTTFDILVAGLQKSGDPAGDLLDTFNEYSGNFAQAGFAIEEFGSILVQSLEAGARNTDDIADGIREFTIRTLDGSQRTREAYAALGIDLDTLYANIESGNVSVADTFQFTIDKLNTVEDDVQRNILGIELFGTKWEDAGEDVFLSLDKNIQALGDFEGAAEEATGIAADGMDNLRQQSEEATQQIKLLIGEAVLPFKTAFLEGTAAVLSSGAALIETVADYREWSKASQEAAFSLYEVSLAQGDVMDGFTLVESAMDRAQFVVNEVAAAYEHVDGAGTRAKLNALALEEAQRLLNNGFSGTSEELAMYAIRIAEANALNTEYDAGVDSVSEKQLRYQTAMEGTVSNLTAFEDAMAGANTETEEATGLSEEAAAAAEAHAEAERARATSVALAQGAVADLQANLQQGFAANLGDLNQGNELDSIEELIFGIAESSNVGAVALAGFAFGLGEVGENVTEALRVEFLKQGIQGLVESVSADGEITVQEINHVIGAANDLDEALQESFTATFETDGADGILEKAAIIEENLTATTSARYGVTITSDAEEAEQTIATLKENLLTFDNTFGADVAADTATAEEDTERLTGKLTELAGEVFDVELDDNADVIQGHVGDLGDTLNGLISSTYNVELDDNTGKVANRVEGLEGALSSLVKDVYTIVIDVDDSAVPSWAIPQSPLPIHTAWMDFVDDMRGASIEPTVNGGRVAGLGLIDGNGGGGIGGSAMIFNGDVYVGDPSANEASRIVTELLLFESDRQARNKFNGSN